MNARTTAVLVLILLAVGAAWWFTRGQTDAPPPPNTTPGAETQPLIAAGSIVIERIDRFEIHQPRQEPVILERTRGTWVMTHPLVFDADARTIQQLLTTLTALADLGEAEGDAITVETTTQWLLTDHAGKTNTIRFGPRIGGGLGSVSIDDGPPRLVKDLLHDFFERYDPTDLLSTQLATPPAFATTRFTITTPGSAVTLEAQDAQWFLNGDPTQPALNEPLAGFIDVGGYLNIPSASQIERFVAGPVTDLSPYGLTRPSVRIDYEIDGPIGDTGRSALLIGSPTDARGASYYATYQTTATTRPVVFVLPAEFSIVMAKTDDDFRDPRVFATPALEVERLVFEGAWSLALTDDQGSMIAPRRSAIGDPARLRGRVLGLLEATAVGYIDAATLGTEGEAPITVTVVPTLGRPSETVTFYDTADLPAIEGDDGRPYCVAVRAGDSVGLIIPYEAVERFGEIDAMDLPIERADAP